MAAFKFTDSFADLIDKIAPSQLPASGVVAGQYTAAAITVDTTGRVTSAQATTDFTASSVRVNYAPTQSTQGLIFQAPSGTDLARFASDPTGNLLITTGLNGSSQPNLQSIQMITNRSGPRNGVGTLCVREGQVGVNESSPTGCFEVATNSVSQSAFTATGTAGQTTELFRFQGYTNEGVKRKVATLDGQFADPADATRRGRVVVKVADASGVDRVAFQAESTGRAANVCLLGSTTSYGGGEGIEYIPECQAVPTTPPTSGVYRFVKNGATWVMGPSGTITKISEA